MNFDSQEDKEEIDRALQDLTTRIWNVAKKYENDCWSLLSLLRTLELLHRQIREEVFEPSLPSTRSYLYQLLKEIEETGGWPYIERMKIQNFLRNFEETLSEEELREVRAENKGDARSG
jgi:hypothetical protein